MKYIVLIVLFFCSPVVALSQLPSLPQQSPSKADTSSVLATDVMLNYSDYQNLRIPPASVFLDAARSYADVKYFDEKIREDSLMLKISRKDWLKYFRLQGNYQYGTNNTYVVESQELVPPPLYGNVSTKTQSWYNVGVVVSIPLDDMFTRKNKNDVVRSRLRQVEYEAQRTLEARQILILEAYNEVVKNLSILKVKAEAVALYDAQMQVSENNFINGRIDIISLSLERARRSDAVVRYQESRAELHNAVTILEMLTKIKIIQK